MSKIYKAVKYEELEEETRLGWQLEQILNCESTKNVSHSAPAASPPQQQNSNGYNNYYTPIVTVESPVVVREPLFLLSKDTDTVSREEKLTQLLTDSKDGHEKWLVEYTKLKQQHDSYRDEADRRTRELGQAAGAQQKLLEANRRLENDLAKICSAIGQLAFDKIVVPK